jgi:hypothetical protein
VDLAIVRHTQYLAGARYQRDSAGQSKALARLKELKPLFKGVDRNEIPGCALTLHKAGFVAAEDQKSFFGAIVVNDRARTGTEELAHAAGLSARCLEVEAPSTARLHNFMFISAAHGIANALRAKA